MPCVHTGRAVPRVELSVAWDWAMRVQSVRCMKVDPAHPLGGLMTAVECILHSTVLKVLRSTVVGGWARDD